MNDTPTPWLPLPEPDALGRYRYADGCLIAPPHTVSLNLKPIPEPSTLVMSGYWARWADGTPLTGDGDGIYSFETAEEAARELWGGGEGPAASLMPEPSACPRCGRPMTE